MRATKAEQAALRAEGAAAERAAAVAHVKFRAERLDLSDARDAGEARPLLARRLHVLADDLAQGLHVGDAL